MQDYAMQDPNPILTPAPPHSVDAERSVIGALLQDPESVFLAVEKLSPEDFYTPEHNAIYKAVLALNSEGKPVDLMTVSEHLNSTGVLASVGGAPYLLQAMRFVPTTANVATYIDIVAEKAALRRMIAAANSIRDRCYAQTEDVQSIVSSASAEIELAHGKTGSSASDPTHIRDILGSVFDTLEETSRRKGAINGMPSGLYDLDRMLTGFHGGEMIILGGRPAMGKTSAALGIAHFAAIRQKRKVLFFSVEMPKAQLVTRLLSKESHVPMQDMRSGCVTAEGWEAIGDAMAELANGNLIIDDNTGITPSQIRTKLKRMQDRNDLPEMVIIDYLGLLESDKRGENRQMEVSAISRQLKSIARDFSVPVIVLSQLSRANAARSDKRPVLTDLRESGSIEQDADVVLFVHREGYYDPDQDQSVGEIIVAKQRNGPVGTVELSWNAREASYDNRPGTVVAQYI